MNFAICLILLSTFTLISSNDFTVVKYGYSDVSVYKLEAPNDTKLADWKSYCRYPYVCFGLYCDYNEVISDAGDCVHYNDVFENFFFFYDVSYLRFKDSYRNKTHRTSLQNYYNELKTGKFPLKMNQQFSNQYFYTYVSYVMNFFEFVREQDNSIPFLARREQENGTQLFLIDYECSLQDSVNKFVKLYQKDSGFHYKINILSIICLTLIIFFYIVLKELRKSLNGKCILIYSCLTLYMFAITMNSSFIFYNKIFVQINRIVYFMAELWLNVICFDTFDVLR
jgi:hypothetical protein